MKELGRKGGKASGAAKPEQVPASLREELGNLDPKVVRAAIEETLAGANQSAKVSAVKLLADVDAFRKDESDSCPRCAKFTEAESKAARTKVDELISRKLRPARFWTRSRTGSSSTTSSMPIVPRPSSKVSRRRASLSTAAGSRRWPRHARWNCSPP
jgi:hypothetical protein